MKAKSYAVPARVDGVDMVFSAVGSPGRLCEDHLLFLREAAHTAAAGPFNTRSWLVTYPG